MRRHLLQSCALVIAITWISPLPAQQKNRPAAKKGSADRVKTIDRSFDVEGVNSTAFTAIVGPNAPSAPALRAQILLDRARYSPGEIDGRYGRNTSLAIQGFQASRGLEPTGILDESAWAMLNEDAEPALVPYVLTKEDVAGPFETIPPDMMEQSKLKSLGYQSAEEAVGEKFHASPALLALLNPGKDLTRAGESIMVPNIRVNAAPGLAERVVVSKNRTVVIAYSATGTVLAQYPATIGSDKDPLPLGSWKVTVVQQDPVFNYNPELFWDADPSHAKARIAPGPNNPVGSAWIGLSKDHYGIHGTPTPGKIGYAESHGCVRLTNWDIKDLASMLKPGREVLFQEP